MVNARKKLGTVHPVAVMDSVQRRIIDVTEAVVLAEGGNAFAWANRYLTFREPGRYRCSMQEGSLGHCGAAVVAVAQYAPFRAVALLGDGSMLYQHEVSTAATDNVNAVWLVFNDGRWGSCEAGQRARGLCAEGLAFCRGDFAAYAQAMGAAGVTVTSAAALDAAIDRAMQHPGPFVIDVRIDPTVPSPLVQRFECFYVAGARRERQA